MAIAASIERAAPPGWRRAAATFALTVSAEAARAFVAVNDVAVPLPVTDEAMQAARENRTLSAAEPDGPWWVMSVTVTSVGEFTVDYGYGGDPFPDEFLFSPSAYLEDLQQYPRSTLPTWLAAHIFHNQRQLRMPQAAAVQSRESAGSARIADDSWPPLEQLWARWAALAAVSVARGDELGPRMLPATAWFETPRRDGSTLVVLPGRRAVLSGGVWNDQRLSAAYLSGGELPRVYDGAPAWVVNATLNERVQTGMLSFCAWYTDGHWYQADSPGSWDVMAALPPIWDTSITVAAIAGGLSYPAQPSEARNITAQSFVEAAEAQTMTTPMLEALLSPAEQFDIDWAANQLIIAGV